MIDLPNLDPVNAAIAKLAQWLVKVESQQVSVDNAAGFVLAEDLLSDRDSPALDVSAMDGFAIRLADWDAKPLPIVAIAAAGSSPIYLAEKSAIRIFTGGPVPIGADTVIARECATESNNHVDFNIDYSTIQLGQHIRRQGENAPAHHLVLNRGRVLSSTAMATLSTFGQAKVSVYRKLNVSIINTGDELVPMGQPVEPWQIRDSNGPYLEQFLKQQPFVGAIKRQSVGDSREKLLTCIQDSLATCDVLLLTGGVSMGDFDYVPEMIQQSGSQIVFHRLPIRPGKPVLGAVGPKGQLICGLPGNPVSVAITSRRIAVPLMRTMAGMQMEDSLKSFVEPPQDSIPPLDLIHYRLCNIDDSGNCQWTPMKGSGDIIALTKSDGFLELPANQNFDLTSSIRYRFFAW